MLTGFLDYMISAILLKHLLRRTTTKAEEFDLLKGITLLEDGDTSQQVGTTPRSYYLGPSDI
jgi:hypothetical protein